MELLRKVVVPGIRMSLKLHQVRCCRSHVVVKSAFDLRNWMWFLTKYFTYSFRITLRPQMSMKSQLFFLMPFPSTSRTWSLLMKVIQLGGVRCCPMPHHSSPCATSSTREPMSTKSLCSIEDILVSALSKWDLPLITVVFNSLSVAFSNIQY